MISLLLFAPVQHLSTPHEFPILVSMKIRNRQSLLHGKCVIWNVDLPNTESLERLREFHVEIDRLTYLALTVTPAAALCGTTHPALDGTITFHLNVLSRRCSSDAARKIQLNARALSARGKVNRSIPARGEAVSSARMSYLSRVTA